MKKFVVAYISFHDNELKQEIIEASTAFHAMTVYLKTGCMDFETEEQLYDYAANSDSCISAIEI